jgi:predicted transcriptional regulator
LQDAGLVVKRQAPGYTCYFPKGKVDRHLMGAAPSLRSDGSRAILQAVAAAPGASSRDLAARLGLAPSTVSYHLKRLEAAGLVAPGLRSGVHLTALGAQASGAGAAA